MKNLGLIIIVLGAIILMLSYFCGWTDYNWVQGSAFLLVIIGIIVHIFVSKRD